MPAFPKSHGGQEKWCHWHPDDQSVSFKFETIMRVDFRSTGQHHVSKNPPTFHPRLSAFHPIPRCPTCAFSSAVFTPSPLFLSPLPNLHPSATPSPRFLTLMCPCNLSSSATQVYPALASTILSLPIFPTPCIFTLSSRIYPYRCWYLTPRLSSKQGACKRKSEQRALVRNFFESSWCMSILSWPAPFSTRCLLQHGMFSHV